MRFELEVVKDFSGSGNKGIRWVEQPEFYPVSDKSNAFLLGHDLMEHFCLQDCSIAAELIATGARLVVRTETYFGMINHRSLNQLSSKDILVDSLKGDLSMCAELLLDHIVRNGVIDFFDEIPHLTEETQWTKKAMACAIRNKRFLEQTPEYIDAFFEVKEYFLKAVSPDDVQFTEVVEKVFERIMAFVAYGFIHARQRYGKFSEYDMALTYKAITHATERLLPALEYVQEYEKLFLNVNINKSTAHFVSQDRELHRFLKSEFF